MGVGQSTYTGPSGLDVPDREGGDGSPEMFMIEPVPEGLEHVVYPKYEEAFRLGLEALTNPMRVNKFYRPLPHILGSIEFQKHSHAGIIPVAKPAGSSGMPTPRQTPFGRPPQVSGSLAYTTERHAPSASEEEAYEKCEKEIKEEEAIGKDWNTVKQAVTLEFSSAHRSYADFEAIQETESKSPSKVSAVSEADIEGYSQQAKLDSVSSVQALDGGLFDADEAMLNALESYRKTHGGSRNEKSVQRTSSRRSELTKISTGRSQMSRDLEQLGRRMSDLQQGLTFSGHSQLTNVAEDSKVNRTTEQPDKLDDTPPQEVSYPSTPCSRRSADNQKQGGEELEVLDNPDEDLQQDQAPSSSESARPQQRAFTSEGEAMNRQIEELQPFYFYHSDERHPRIPSHSSRDSENSEREEFKGIERSQSL